MHDLFEHVPQDRQPLLTAHIVGAQSYKGRHSKADPQVQHKHSCNACHRRVEPKLAKRTRTKTNGRECEHAGVQGYVADIQWKAKEVSNLRHEAHKIAQRDTGAPGSYVVVKPAGNVPHSLHTDFLAERMLRDGGRNAVINYKVFAPS